ncbi:MAG TPA: glycoside hydrolase family 3 N-terminal domain-containing protein [Saprospiraceae bacterium]|nr:glycoside hydrolase family 3 N-terminal domain-containing protein [Saprospiraceae bacterium]HMQ81888.1 glycoside hydrolase family 3 N-terminal domain-containing protein [Saprospiraceae bacterium]
MMKKTYLHLLCFVLLAASSSLFGQDYKYPFQNPALSIEKRVDDLIARMTLEEKVGQLMYSAPAIERLDVPAYNWWNECLHGIARNGRATVFPQAIGMAATFDTDLMQRVGEAISDEARAKYNVSAAKGFRGRYQGLTFWTPNVNLFRDPRWGRGQETYGEDPYLTSRIGVSFVEGLQGDHPKYLKTAAMAKHYAVHSGPEGLRHEFDAQVSMKDLWETYLPAFEALVTEANVEGVMGAYNRTNGDPCCAHPYLMEEVLRKKWGFDGYFVSDCWALVDFYAGHKIVKTPQEAAALALNSGCNLNCGSTYPELVKSIEQGLTTEAEVDQNLRELLPTRFRLGLFDPPGMTPFDHIGPEVIACDEHLELSKEAATKSIVLLKNNGLLPLSKDMGYIFVTGPTAAHAQALLANYYGLSDQLTTILEGVVGKVSPHTSVHYSQGALLDEPNRNPIDWFSGEAADAEVTIACLGISQLIEGEEGESIASRFKGDREDIGLPPSQIEFLKTIRSKAKKLVVVLTGGSAIACPEVYDMADALIFAWYPGEQGGNAVGDILFGDAVPSGRLPVTFPKSVKDLPPYDDYDMSNRTYRYMQTEPLFPFGFGLSYTTFQYSNLKLSQSKISPTQSLELEVTITNTGNYKADEVVQLYISDVSASVTVPKYALKGFQKVSLWPGAAKTLRFTITPDLLKMVNEKGERVLEKGDFKLYVGGAQPAARSLELGAAQWLEGVLKVE